MRTCEFADGLRISAARFAGRTESSAPTAFEKFSRFCVGGDAHIDPRAIADSHWIFAKTAHTAGAIEHIAPLGSYELAGDLCIIGFTHRVDVGIDPYAYFENFRKSVRTRVPGNLPGKESMKHGRGFGSGGSILLVQA